MNWLGFSLSSHPQPAPVLTTTDHHSNQDDVSGTDVSGDCFDLTSDSAASLNHLPHPFGIFEPFNRSDINHTQTQSQDWNMKRSSDDNYKSSSSSKEVSMATVLASSFSSQTLESHNHRPKLENLLGRHSFAMADQTRQTLSSVSAGSSLPYNMFEYDHTPAGTTGVDGGTPATTTTNNNNPIGSSNSSSIGLSMIKTWLRNQPYSTQSNPHAQSHSHHKNTNIKHPGVGDGASAPADSTIYNINGGAQALSLSMGSDPSAGSTLPLLTASGGESTSTSDNNKKKKQAKASAEATEVDGQTGGALAEAVPRKSIDTFGQRTSIYRGVTRHRWTGRYEAHLWDNSCRREGQTRKGRQVYLGGYDKEDKAARAYDLAALKYWGTTTTTNFPISNYEKELDEMKHMTRQEYVASLRRKSSGFSRGASIYRGVTRHHQHGRWQARIGRVAGNKDLYLGTFSTQEEAAEAYDIAAIKFRGINAVTNFDMSRYDVKSILESSALPIGGAAKRLKNVDQQQAEIMSLAHHHHGMILDDHDHDHGNLERTLMNGVNGMNDVIRHRHHHHDHLMMITGNNHNNTHHNQQHFYPGNNGININSTDVYLGNRWPSTSTSTTTLGVGFPRLWCKQEQHCDSSMEINDHDLQVQCGNTNTHNFFHDQSSSSSCSSVMLQGSSSSSSNGRVDHGFAGYGYGNYGIPMSSMIMNPNFDDHHGNIDGGYEYDHQSHGILLESKSESSVVHDMVVKASTYDHQGNMAWVPTAVPTSSSTIRSTNTVMALCPPAPDAAPSTFTL